MLHKQFDEIMLSMPLVAILRGIESHEVEEVADALIDCGIRLIEVPLNSPDPLHSIERLRRHMEGRGLCGAGTVTSVAEVADVQRAGGQLLVSPNCDTAVITATLAADLVSLPGCFTPSEVFSAIGAGATSVKLFPAGTLGAGYTAALGAVLPDTVRTIAVGGIGASEMADYWRAGVRGFGLGSNLYRPGDSALSVRRRAGEMARAAQALA